MEEGKREREGGLEIRTSKAVSQAAYRVISRSTGWEFKAKPRN